MMPIIDFVLILIITGTSFVRKPIGIEKVLTIDLSNILMTSQKLSKIVLDDKESLSINFGTFQ
jgi:hypothetical protein